MIFVLTAVISFLLGFAILLWLLGGRSPVLTTRLMEATAAGPMVGRGGVESLKNRTAEVVGQLSRIASGLRRLVGLSPDPGVARRLAIAGYRNPEYVEIYYAAKLIGPVVAALIAGFFIKSNVLFWFFALAAGGFFAADLWLDRTVARRRNAIRLSLPDALDLLVICVDAGLGLDQALIRVGQELKISHPELSDELLFINLEQRAGKPRIEAWRHMAERTGLDTVRSFVTMLAQTERFGTPISKSLATFAESLRTRRRQQAEEMAAKTTVKLIFPLVFLIFPSMFIVLLAPAAITLMRTLGESFGR